MPENMSEPSMLHVPLSNHFQYALSSAVTYPHFFVCQIFNVYLTLAERGRVNDMAAAMMAT